MGYYAMSLVLGIVYPIHDVSSRFYPDKQQEQSNQSGVKQQVQQDDETLEIIGLAVALIVAAGLTTMVYAVPVSVEWVITYL